MSPTYREPQRDSKHPPEYEQDLNPNRMEGQNIGEPEARRHTAADIKDLTIEMQAFTHDELRQIPIVPEGHRLHQGATYLDLRDRHRNTFRATAEIVAGPGHWFVPKSETPYQLWNRLIGAEPRYRRARSTD